MNTHTHTIKGIEGIYTLEEQKEKILKQTWQATRNGLTVTIRHDDPYRNGHNSFAITGETEDSFGCIHDEIAATFPELAHLIKWHLCSTDGPMHYVANTLWHVSDRDHYGLRKGEVKQIINGRTGLPAWELVYVLPDGSVGDPVKYPDSHTQPELEGHFEYRPLNRIGEGKEPNLAYARSRAAWPEATDEELLSPNLKEMLLARLPKLLEDFRKDVEDIGFIWEK